MHQHIHSNYQDRYNDPGDFVTEKGKYGEFILALQKKSAFLLGEGFTEKGQFPFLDQVNLESNKKNRIYQSSYTDKFEQLYDYDPKARRLNIRIESKNEYPNYFTRNLYDMGNKLDQLTYFENPFRKLENVGKELITYKRKDGLDLSGILYTPEGFDSENPTPLPMILWAYPREYKDKSSASQKTNNPNLEFVMTITGVPIGCAGAAFNMDDKEFRAEYNMALAKLKATGEFAAIIEPYGFSAEATAGESYLTRCPDGK